MNALKKGDTFDLDTNHADAIAAVVKGAAGALPVIGTALGEVIVPFIRNQRHERMAHLIQSIAEKVEGIPVKKLTMLLKSPHVAHVFEEGLLSSLNVYSENRRAEIAALIVSSMNQETINEEVTISLIRTLAELNDTEMILLISFSKFASPEFRRKHENIIMGRVITSSTTEEEYEYALMYRKYISHLEALDLLRPLYERRPKGHLADMMEWNPTKKTSYVASPLANKLLNIIMPDQETSTQEGEAPKQD